MASNNEAWPAALTNSKRVWLKDGCTLVQDPARLWLRYLVAKLRVGAIAVLPCNATVFEDVKRPESDDMLIRH